MITFFSKPANNNSIKQLMKIYAGCLDDEYLRFLKKYNGIFVDGDGDYVDIQFSKVKNKFISFQSLFGLNTSNRNFDILLVNDNLQKNVVSITNFLVIGEDPGGNFYMLSNIQGAKKVLYWDRTYLHDDAGGDCPDIIGRDEEGNFYVVSENFKEFWDLLDLHINKMKFVQQDNLVISQ